jgi:5-methyltetrahydrofolate--homocysteine methyltransferase
VENDCQSIYRGKVHYAKDAFEGLRLMDAMCSEKNRTPSIPGPQPAISSKVLTADEPVAKSPSLPPAASTAIVAARPLPEEDARRLSESLASAEVPIPPFWGSRVLESIPLRAVLPYLNETVLFSFHWGYRKGKRKAADYEQQLREEVQPRYRDLVAECEKQMILQPKAIYGFYRCQSENETLILYDEQQQVLVRLSFPRQQRKPHLCLSDYFHSVQSGTMDVVVLQVVTVGQHASDIAREWFASDRYTDYLHLHGLSVESTEALAEYVHKQVRSDLGIAGQDARDIKKLIKGKYQGCRYSFGYPACPRLEDQEILLRVLEADRLKISLSEGWQLYPELSTSALVVHHPQAAYFSV